MPKTKSGKRTAHFRVQIVEEGSQILMFFDDYDQPPLNFNRDSGTSGPKAYGKLSKILDLAEEKDSDKKS